MQELVKYLSALILGALVIGGLLWRPKPPQQARVDTTAQLLRVREVGDLVALTARFKDVEEWHTKSSKTYEGKKMLLVCESEIEFKFPLDRLEVSRRPDGTYLLSIPPCFVDCGIRDVHIYDEQPGVKFGAISIAITTEQRNAAIKHARDAAKKSALKDSNGLLAQAEASAKRTVASICQALGLTSDQYTIEVHKSHAEIEPRLKSLDDAVDRRISEVPGG